MNELSWYSIPAIISYIWIGYECLYFYFLRRKKQKEQAAIRFAGWVIRPWAVWAVVSIIFRLNAARGFNNIRTFPFFANLWFEKLPAKSVIWKLILRPETYIWLTITVVLGGLLLYLLNTVLKADHLSARLKGGTILGSMLLICALWLSIACLPLGPTATGPKQPGSLLAAWNTSNATLLYGMPMIKNTSHFLRHYHVYHKQLKITVHGHSHPAGAPLSLYWLGELMGADSADIRSSGTKLRYLLGVVLFSTLNIGVLLLLGSALFNNWKAGLITAIFWALSPAAVAYASFSQDVVYAVFFNLALYFTWRIGTAEKTGWMNILLLGATLFCLTLLKYSWCIVAAIFFIFNAVCGRRSKWHWKDYVLRIITPLCVMTGLLLGVLLVYKLNYLKFYSLSQTYVKIWYRFTEPYQWIMALIGGQIDLWLMMGSVPASLFVLQLPRLRKWREWKDRDIFLLVILGLFVLPLLFGPSALKMETSRCWMWITSVPFAFCAGAVLKMENPRKLVTGICIISLLTSVLMRLLMNFGC